LRKHKIFQYFFVTHHQKMSTKYELATELRALTRGMKPLPICRMKKHELEAEIDRIKAVNAMKEAMDDYPKAKPGPLGPRSIPTTDVTDKEVKISVPIAPSRRDTKPKLAMRRAEAVTVNFDDDTPKKMEEISASTVATVTERLSSDSRTVATTERQTPVKSLPPRPAKVPFSHPGAPLPTDRPVHRCNCPLCPGNGSV